MFSKLFRLDRTDPLSFGPKFPKIWLNGSRPVALVVLAIYFLVLDQQTQESRLQQLVLLQHLKRSRRKRLILLQVALLKTRRVRRAWSWPRNQFWFETLLNGNFVEEWWKENFRIT